MQYVVIIGTPHPCNKINLHMLKKDAVLSQNVIAKEH